MDWWYRRRRIEIVFLLANRCNTDSASPYRCRQQTSPVSQLPIKVITVDSSQADASYGVMVLTRWSRSTKLIYAGAVGYWERWPCPGFPGAGKSISVYNQSLRSTQPGHPSVGRRNEYQPKGDAMRLGVTAGMVREWVAEKTAWSPCYYGPYLNVSSKGSSHNRALYKCLITLTLTS